jgi:hypothetical protein
MLVLMQLFAHWDHASVRHFADLVLELDGRVVNAKIVVQPLLDVAQDTLAD